jgi:transcriptional regulator with XRE-family HTH domain
MRLTLEQLAELRDTPLGATGNRLARAIELSGVTLSQIHEATGLSVSYVSDTARGRYKTITVDNGDKLARFFGCQIEDLFLERAVA